MPKQGMSLRMIKDVIRLKWHARLSHAQIATALKISKGVVAKYVGLATAASLDWEAVQDWSEQQLSTALQPRSAASQAVVVPDWGRVHLDLDRKGVTVMLLWQEYVAAHPEDRTWRYTQFCEHYKTFAGTLKRSMRQHRCAGEKLFIAPVRRCLCATGLGPRCSSRRWPPRATSSPAPRRTNAWTTGSRVWCARCTSTAACRS